VTLSSTCGFCGQDSLLKVRETIEWPVGNRRAMVEVEHEHCSSCGESVMTPAQMDAAQRAASNAIRLAECLLLPDEIRHVRERAGLSQENFERVLRVGRKTAVRWERGTVFQSPSTDELIRTYDKHPELLEERCEALGIQSRHNRRRQSGWAQTPSVTYWAPDLHVSEQTGKVLPFSTRDDRAAIVVLEPEVEVPKIARENLR
jgi:putative zinc finger/helix-turn-helix YgiT family protein